MTELNDSELEAALDGAGSSDDTSHPMHRLLAATSAELAGIAMPTPSAELDEFLPGRESKAVTAPMIALASRRQLAPVRTPARRWWIAAASVLGLVGLAQLTGAVDVLSSDDPVVELATQPDTGFRVAVEDAGSVVLVVDDGRLRAQAVVFADGWSGDEGDEIDRVAVVFRNDGAAIFTLEAVVEGEVIQVVVADLASGSRTTSYYRADGAPVAAPAGDAGAPQGATGEAQDGNSSDPENGSAVDPDDSNERETSDPHDASDAEGADGGDTGPQGTDGIPNGARGDGGDAEPSESDDDEAADQVDGPGNGESRDGDANDAGDIEADGTDGPGSETGDGVGPKGDGAGDTTDDSIDLNDDNEDELDDPDEHDEDDGSEDDEDHSEDDEDEPDDTAEDDGSEVDEVEVDDPDEPDDPDEHDEDDDSDDSDDDPDEQDEQDEPDEPEEDDTHEDDDDR